ncbi:methionine--tRNA ligase [Plasticicumulans acidivorans]|uniref:Methionine--tRNA ligase n=1 Tax=Plasticicumulans acidivorans TaxID=886464 RepID=A0A317MQN5_9GAMM|nr:methionine--tRNA ligase [Plasticicumulans acidivorans]PWV58835.1 methionyl-tRNA synthetase [Plasticicumulans acidivorans]
MTIPVRSILVTSALPYANGPIHLGHMVEYIQTDIWVRFQRLRGNNCYYVCADDAHGTPIMLRAQAEGLSPEELIARISSEHQADFSEFLISFDQYHSTHSSENKFFAELIYERLTAGGHIEKKTIHQAYDPEKGMFLPDRFIKGECPRCGAADQYGDSCEVCGATYSPAELKNPRSAISGAVPISKDSEHFFFRLTDFEAMLREWIANGHVQEEMGNKLVEWFREGLQSWDISRDAPYWGFEIPDAPGKFFYVWLDAPIGYMASFKKFCERENLDFDHYWKQNSEAELYHFIGKDIAYFHTLFWPAMLDGAGFRKPTSVFCHGFLTVNGQKMSKSRGTFIKARTYLEYLRPEYLRYYFATKLSDRIEDIDLALDDFQARVNSDLVNKYVNIASRCAGFINKRFSGELASDLPDPILRQQFVSAGESIATAYENREFGRAMREIMALADRANQYIDETKPWVLAKQKNNEQLLHGVCSQGIELFRLLTIYLKPVLPQLTAEVEQFLEIPALQWSDLDLPLINHHMSSFKPLMQRIDNTQIDAIIVASQETLTQTQTQTQTQTIATEKKETQEIILPTISIDDFRKIDLRIARIITADFVPDSDKLIKLTLDIGSETRQVFAGIRHVYEPSDLVGRLTLVAVNLAPRKMRFGNSEGMLLGASEKQDEIYLLSPDSGAVPGMRVQ